MRNVFGTSDDSESEPELESRPVKKLKLKALSPAIPTNDEAEYWEDYKTLPLSEEEADSNCKETSQVRASLNTSLIEQNSIGLSMMQRMGFKVGDTLGRTANAQKEPIRVVAKNDRLGIRVKSLIKSEGKSESEAMERYVEQRLEKQIRRNAEINVLQLQRFCFKASGDDEAIQSGERMGNINVLWRSLAMLMNGKARKGRVLIDQEAEEEEEDLDEEVEAFQAKKSTEQLLDLITYSRDNFHYCLYCLVQFDNAEDLRAHCPGPNEDDHSL